MEEALILHDVSSAFAQCIRSGFSLANSDGGWDDETWSQLLEERQWMEKAQYLRLKDDTAGLPASAGLLNTFDFETPQYHLLTLAKDGVEQALSTQFSSLCERSKALLKQAIAVVNVDGSVGEECEPLNMTLKTRVYALGAPRSLELRHEWHRQKGWDGLEYIQRVSWRLNHSSECGRRFMPSYKRDENGWHTMFHANLEASSRPASGAAAAASGGSRAAARGGRGRGRGRGRGNKRGRVEELADTAGAGGGGGGDTETGTDSVVGEAGDDEGQTSGLLTGHVATTTTGQAEDSSGGTGTANGHAGEQGEDSCAVQPHRQAGGRSAMVQGPAARGRGAVMRQKWMMTGEQLEAIHEHLLAGTDLEEEVGGFELLELLLSCVGIARGKVGEVEVGKVVYGKTFLEFYMRKTAQATNLEGGGGGGGRSGAGSQAGSEDEGGAESEGEADHHAAYHNNGHHHASPAAKYHHGYAAQQQQQGTHTNGAAQAGYPSSKRPRRSSAEWEGSSQVEPHMQPAQHHVQQQMPHGAMLPGAPGHMLLGSAPTVGAVGMMHPGMLAAAGMHHHLGSGSTVSMVGAAGGHLYGTTVVGAGPAPVQLPMTMGMGAAAAGSMMHGVPPGGVYGYGAGGMFVGSSMAGGGAGMMMMGPGGGSLAASRAPTPTPTGSLGSWGGPRGQPGMTATTTSMGSVGAAQGQGQAELPPAERTSRRKRASSRGGTQPQRSTPGLPPLGPTSLTRHSTEVEAS